MKLTSNIYACDYKHWVHTCVPQHCEILTTPLFVAPLHEAEHGASRSHAWRNREKSNCMHQLVSGWCQVRILYYMLWWVQYTTPLSFWEVLQFARHACERCACAPWRYVLELNDPCTNISVGKQTGFFLQKYSRNTAACFLPVNFLTLKTSIFDRVLIYL